MTKTDQTKKCSNCGKDAALFINSRKAPFLKCEKATGGCGFTAFLPRSAAPKESAASGTAPAIATETPRVTEQPAAPARKPKPAAKPKRAAKAKTPATPAPAPKEEPRAKRDYPWQL